MGNFFFKNSLKSKFIPKFCCRENKFRLKKKKSKRKKRKKEIQERNRRQFLNENDVLKEVVSH